LPTPYDNQLELLLRLIHGLDTNGLPSVDDAHDGYPVLSTLNPCCNFYSGWLIPILMTYQPGDALFFHELLAWLVHSFDYHWKYQSAACRDEFDLDAKVI
jgi:hypothetical protein